MIPNDVGKEWGKEGYVGIKRYLSPHLTEKEPICSITHEFDNQRIYALKCAFENPQQKNSKENICMTKMQKIKTKKKFNTAKKI